MRQKTALLRALAHGPKVLLLDEPTAGLDITSARTVRSLVEQIKLEGGTVVYSTHQLFEAQQVCDRIIIIHNGNVMADGSPEQLINDNGCETLEEAYVMLTQAKARVRFEDRISDKGLTKIWNKLFRPKTPNLQLNQDVMEDGKSTQRIKTIAKKEVVEFVRDWRTIVAIIIIPILMFPVLFIVFPVLLESEAAELDNKVVNIEIQSNQYPMYLIESFNESYTKLTYVNATFNDSLSLPLSDLDRVRNMEIDAILD